MGQIKPKIYIHKNVDAAIPITGVAAFFCSTEIYYITPLNLYVYILFPLIADKPIIYRPRCRSPPAPIRFSQFKKTNGGEVNAKLAERQELQETREP